MSRPRKPSGMRAGGDGTIGKRTDVWVVKYKSGRGEMDHRLTSWLLEHDKYSRRIMANMYNFVDLSEMNLEPLYSMTFQRKG